MNEGAFASHTDTKTSIPPSSLALEPPQAHEESSTKDHVMEWAEELRPSRYAEALPQLEPHRKISPNPQDWRCDETGVTENLWLNLSTGFIGSGRQVGMLPRVAFVARLC
jgi:uncharacterized UBP type Zn finger protein